ncbi:MAG: hypothetical protein ABJD11_08875 [Gemmatimonadota bacterium]
MPTRLATIATLGLLLAGCHSCTTAGTGRTEHERDSVLGQSKVPGASVVQKANAAQDSARARVGREDSMATSP